MLGKNVKMVYLITTLFLVSTLSGCVVQTWEWSHADQAGTSITLHGRVSWFAPELDLWELYFVWDTVSHEDVDSYAHVEENVAILGNSYYVTLEGLDRTTEYFYRAVGELQTVGQPKLYVGAEDSFKPGWPSVATWGPSDVTSSSTMINGHLYHLGGDSNCEVWFEYGISKDNLNEQTAHQTLPNTADFSAELTGLTEGEVYYYQACAENDIGDIQTGIVEQVTPGAAEVITKLASDIQSTSAVTNGRLVHMAGASSCEVWFEYGADPDNLDQSTSKQTLTGAGDFSSHITGLQPDTAYWYRAVADNGQYVSYGGKWLFTTQSSFIATIGHNLPRAEILKEAVQEVLRG